MTSDFDHHRANLDESDFVEALDELPMSVLFALEETVLVEDWEMINGRLETLGLLVEEFYELEDDQIAAWIESFREQDISSTDVDSKLVIAAGAAERTIFANVVDRLMTYVFAIDRTTDAVSTLQLLLGHWSELANDDEVMVGHLILKHGQTDKVAKMNEDERLKLHAQLHASARSAADFSDSSER